MPKMTEFEKLTSGWHQRLLLIEKKTQNLRYMLDKYGAGIEFYSSYKEFSGIVFDHNFKLGELKMRLEAICAEQT